MPVQHRLIRTTDGWLGIVRSNAGLRRLYLPEPGPASVRSRIGFDHPGSTEHPQMLPALVSALVDFFDGAVVDFRKFEHDLDFGGYGTFEIGVWRACAAIPYGETRSYKDLAVAVDNPAAARAVGAAMGRNPLPVVVPCHRVLKSDGSLGGYSGSLGVSFKQRLLEMEAAAVAVSAV